MDLSTSALAWIEFSATRIPFQDRASRTYRAIGISLVPERKEVILRLRPVKEVGILAQGFIPVYRDQSVAGMFEVTFSGGEGKLRALSNGFEIGVEDLNNPMLAYYEVGEPDGNSDRQRIGIPVTVTGVITGKRQIKINPKTGTVKASPDLNGKTVKIRSEFPFPEPGNRISDSLLSPAILCGEKITRYHGATLAPWNDKQRTTFLFRDWKQEEVESLRR